LRPKTLPKNPNRAALVTGHPLGYRAGYLDSLATQSRAGRTQRNFSMKTDIHPHYHFIKVVMTDGTEYYTRSTYGADGATLNLDIDPTTHPAWTGGSQHLVDRGGRLSRFNSRFGNLGIGKK